MNRRPRYLGDLFQRIVWTLAVPVAGCGSSVTMASGADASADVGADVAAPIDRGTIVDVAQPDAGYCVPSDGGFECGGADLLVFPCALPPEARVAIDASIPVAQCRTLCATVSGASGYCTRLAPLPDGSERVACTNLCVVGRRTDGLMAVEGASEAGPLGDYFSRVATLEWASVTSFERLADDLARHGAPSELVAEALRSADDERRHTRSMGALARRFGAPVRAPEFAEAALHSMEDLAVENAVEGCVRETYGALVATWQARAARDAAVAEALRTVAADETRHAEFSWAVAAWADGVLDEAARARVAAARDAAAAALWAELDGDVDASLVSAAGMPDGPTGRALLAALTAATQPD